MFSQTECLGKIESTWFIYKKLQAISTIYKLSGQKFWWNCLEFSNKISLTSRMRIFNIKNIVKHRDIIYLKFRYKFLTYLIMTVSALQLKKKASILSSVFDICCRCKNSTYFDNKVCLTKKDRL